MSTLYLVSLNGPDKIALGGIEEVEREGTKREKGGTASVPPLLLMFCYAPHGESHDKLIDLLSNLGGIWQIPKWVFLFGVAAEPTKLFRDEGL